jgi:hypothetical protein
MTTHLYVEVKPALLGLDPNVHNRVELVRAQEKLKSLAEELNVWPLTAFYSYDRAGMENLFRKDELATMPEEAQSFSPARGLETVQALRKKLPELLGGQDIRVEETQQELADLEVILTAALAADSRFCLYPGP